MTWRLLNWWLRHPTRGLAALWLAGVVMIVITAGGSTDRFATGDRTFDRIREVVIFTAIAGIAWRVAERRRRRRR